MTELYRAGRTRELVVSASDVVGLTYYDSRWVFGEARRVNAPWTTVRVAGRRLPLMFDARDERCDRKLAAKLLGI